MKTWWAAGLILVALVAPMGLSGYWLRFLTFVFLWIGLAGSLNLLTGYTGYLDFGHTAFFGTGAYVTGILMVKTGMPFGVAMLGGGAAAAALAVIAGIPTMRLKGTYFAIAMLAFAEAMHQIVLEADGLTGGGNGLSLPIYTSYPFFYYMMLLAALAVIGAMLYFERSKFGKGLMAIRQSETAAEMSGVNTLVCKLAAFAISAFFAGVIGGIYAYWMTFLYPGDVFNVLMTVRMIIMAFLGGAGTMAGPIVGAAFLATTEEVLWAQFRYTYLILVGLVVVTVVLAMPRGLVGLIRREGAAPSRS